MNIFSLFSKKPKNITYAHVDPVKGLNYDEIADGIFIGTNQCCSMTLADVLKKEGIQADISLEGERLDQPFGVEMYIWIPVIDHEIPTFDQVTFGIASLEKLVAEKKKVYLHCKNGHGRSSTMMTIYLMKNRNISYEEAMAIIKQGRPGAHMQEKQIAFVKKYIAEKVLNKSM